MAVIKILSRHTPSYGSLINYILRETANEKPQVISHNLHSIDPELATKEFILNESFSINNRENKVFLTHELLSFSNQDTKKMTPEILEDIAKKYLELRAMNGLVIGALHRDKDHTHWHFAVSGTKIYEGTAMRLSHKELKSIKTQLQEYYIAKYPQLEKSLCNHGSKAKEYVKDKQRFKEQRENLKPSVQQTVAYCLDIANSKANFLDLLQINGLLHYERNLGEPTGVIANDMKFRFNRLDIDMEKMNTLPLDSEEQRILREIQSLRDQRQEKSQNRISQIDYWNNANMEKLESDLTPHQREKFEFANDGVMKNYPDRFDPEDSEPDIDTEDEKELSDKEEDKDEIDITDDIELENDFDR